MFHFYHIQCSGILTRVIILLKNPVILCELSFSKSLGFSWAKRGDLTFQVTRDSPVVAWMVPFPASSSDTLGTPGWLCYMPFTPGVTFPCPHVCS